MSKLLNVDVVKEVKEGEYELAPIEINVDHIVGIRDWSGEMDEGLEAYGIDDYTGSITEIALSNGVKYLAAVTFQTVCEALKEEKDSLLSALVVYVAERRQAEYSGDDEEAEYVDDYTQGCHDGTISVLNDISEILKNFGK